MASKPDYTKFDKRLYRVPDDRPYYHGTQAKEFESANPGTHVTTEYKLAKEFAQYGSFAEGDTGKKGRVVEFRVGVPDEKIPRIAFTDKFHNDVDDITDEDGDRDYDKLTEIVNEYNRQADAEAKERGYSAYYSGDRFDANLSDDGRVKITGDLRVLDPELIRIVHQDVKRPRKSKDKIGFYDLSQPRNTKAKAGPKKKARGTIRR